MRASTDQKTGNMRRRLTKVALSVATVCSLAVGIGAMQAEPAHAWSQGNVWVNFGAWNCPAGGSVVGVYWAVDANSSGPAAGDWGDNVIYPRVRVGSGSYNTLSYTTMCRRFGWTYRGVTSQRRLTPYKSGLSYTY